MSDWEDDEPQPAKMATHSYRNTNQNGGDWDDQSTSYQNTSRYSGNNDQQCDQITFTISKSNVGLVIGRGGSKIKELENRYSVKLNIGRCIFSLLRMSCLHRHFESKNSIHFW